ncbi:MAG: Ig-like domain-containing protein [Clostridia bacterium]|nr:Ig-like domain-containing protein [Clostridia bacterium]MBP3652467.1 Ig-like domain-containing protein [Clostridia bacterium]
MKKMTAAILCLVLFVMTGAVAETVETEATVIALAETMELVVEAAQAENAETVWASSDETIVTVDANGVATALNAGEAVITATVTTTTVETVEDTVYEIVRDTNAEGQLVTRREEKTVSEDVEKVTTEEIEINVVVEAALCPGCGAEYTSAEEYTAHVQIAVCGAEGHYVCDGQDHETVLDEFCANENPHRICQAGVATHECESCGKTYACEDSGSHTTCIACGNAWCFKDNGNHTTPCGKRNHRACVVENYDKDDHYRCDYCGDLRCDGDRHGKGKCVAGGGFVAPSLPMEPVIPETPENSTPDDSIVVE